jgi:predicted transglutaminase-like cysteine proteinase
MGTFARQCFDRACSALRCAYTRAETGGFETMATSIRHGRNAILFALGVLAAALIFGAPARAVPTSKAPVYEIDDYPFQKAPALLRWRSVQQREAQLMARHDPDDCKDGEPRHACAVKEVLLLEEKLQDKSPVEQVEAVYAYFNAVKYQEHPANCGIDCWKSRVEFMADREGDCGDHALAEYFTLKRLGFKERDLQLIIAQLPGFADSFKGGHVVLRVRAEGEYFILDNRRNDLVDLGGLRRYKVLAGINADSVQIYNLVTPTPPPGYVDDATQVAALVTSPGAAELPPEDVQVAEVAPAEPALQTQAPQAQAPQVETPQAETPAFSTQPKPTLVAAVAEPAPAAPQPETEAAAASFDDGSETMCLQAANLGDWNPFLPCTPTKMQKIVIKPKIIIGAEPPKPVEVQPSKPIAVAVAQPETPAPKVIAEPKAVAVPKPVEPKVAETQPVTKPVVVESEPASEAEAEDDGGSCVQGATLADWNPDLPCSADGNASMLRIQVKE